MRNERISQSRLPGGNNVSGNHGDFTSLGDALGGDAAALQSCARLCAMNRPTAQAMISVMPAPASRCRARPGPTAQWHLT